MNIELVLNIMLTQHFHICSDMSYGWTQAKDCPFTTPACLRTDKKETQLAQLGYLAVCNKCENA